MNQDSRRPYFDGLAVRSPACCSGESKDQDRLYWHPVRQAGAVCDGVSNSPSSAAAAQLAAILGPSLFAGDCAERVRMLCDVLEGLRLDVQAQPIRVAPQVPVAMHQLLAEVAREKRRFSYQTTLVAAQLAIQQEHAVASVIRCGDSVFLAYSSKGTLLVADGLTDRLPPATAAVLGRSTHKIRCGPGDTIRVKVVSKACDRPVLARRASLSAHAASDWMLCQAVASDSSADENSAPSSVFLSIGELFMVPHYLLQPDSKLDGSCRLTWSRCVRRLVSHARWTPADWQHAGAVTAALPDAFHRNKWTCWRDCFPLDSQFILASDGFYRAFPDDQSLWTWLQTHRESLVDPLARTPLLRDLHRQLHVSGGDDDISFIWIHPHGSHHAGAESL